MNNFKKAIPFLIGIASFFIRFISLSQTSFANGWDTYFYLVQLKSLIEEGTMHTSEWCLIYSVLYIIQFITNDYIVTAKITSALLAALVSVSMYLIAHCHLKSWLLALVIACISIFSPSLTYFAAQWPKNLLGVVIYLLLVLFLEKKSYKWVFLLLLIGFFGHRMTAILGNFTTVTGLIASHFNLKYLLLAIPVAFIGLIIIHFFPGLLSFHDLERFDHLFDWHFKLPHLWFISYFSLDKINSFWLIEIIFIVVAWLSFFGLLLYRIIRKQSISPIHFSLIAVYLVLWFPLYHLDINGIPYRLFHAGLILSPLLVSSIIKHISIRSKINWAIVLTLFISSIFALNSYNPKKHDPPYKLYHQITLKAKKKWGPARNVKLIIAHKALAEYITYYTGIDALPWKAEYELTADEVIRIAYLPFPQLFEYHTNEKPIKITGNYFLVEEKAWDSFVTGIKEFEEEDMVKLHLTWQNPNTIRPDFLLKN